MDDARRVAHRRGAGRHGFDDHRVRADARTVPDREAAQHLRARAHHHIAAQRRVPLGAFVKRGTAQRDALVNRAAVADLGRLAHHHAHGVVKKHTVADLGARMDFNAGDAAREVRDKAPQPLEPVRPAPVGAAMQDERMDTGVTGQHFPGGAGGGVTFQNALDVGAESGKHDPKSTWGRQRPAAWPWPPRAGYGFLRARAARG